MSNHHQSFPRLFILASALLGGLLCLSVVTPTRAAPSPGGMGSVQREQCVASANSKYREAVRKCQNGSHGGTGRYGKQVTELACINRADMQLALDKGSCKDQPTEKGPGPKPKQTL